MSVAEILQAMAENASRSRLQRGALIGNSVAGISQVPAQIIEDQTKDALLKRRQAIENEQLGFQRNADTRAQSDQSAQDQATKLATARANALKLGIAAGFGNESDPKNFNEAEAIKAVTNAGFPDLAPAIVETHKKLLPTLTSGAPGSVMRDASGAVVPGSEIPANKPDYTVNGQRFSGSTNQPLGSPVAPQVTPAAAQTHNMRLDGVGDVPVDYVPNKDGSGGKWMYQGSDVSGKVKAIPPASITIRNEQNSKASNMPAWALDDSRPFGDTKNSLDKSILMTPNGLYQAALNYIANGQFPQTGRGSDPVAIAQRAAITSKVGAIAAASGMDEPALRAFYKSNAASLTQQQKTFDTAQSNIATADRNVAELDKLLVKLPDTGSPLFNKPLRAFAKDVQGDPNMGPIATFLASVQNEYGKIISSSNGAQVLTDSARHEAQQLIDPDATVAQMLGSIQALKTEGGNRLLSVGEQIQRIQQRMQSRDSETDTKLITEPKTGVKVLSITPVKK